MLFRSILRLIGLGLAVVCCGAAQAKSPISLDVLRRDGYGVVRIAQPAPNTLVVPVSINGHSVKLLLDTGWGSEGITVDEASGVRVQAKGMKESGETAFGASHEISGGMAESVVIGNVQIHGAPVFFGKFNGLGKIDGETHGSLLGQLSIGGAAAVGASGFLGRGFLRKNNAVIDLANLQLYLRPPGKGRRVDLGPALKAAGMGEASFAEMAHGNFLVNVEVNGVAGKMIMDTGASLTGLDVRFAARAKVRGNGRYGLNSIDAAGLKREEDLAEIGSFKIAGVPVHSPSVTLDNFRFYGSSGGKIVGLLGLDVLGQNWGIIDFGQQKLYFARAR